MSATAQPGHGPTRLLAGRWRGAIRRRSRVATAGLLVLGSLTALGPSLARAEPLASHGTCPATTFPPGHLYQLGFTGTLTGHLSLTDSPVGPITFPPISGTFCGLLQLPSETAVVQPANLGFAPFDASFARAMVPAVISAMAPSVGTVAPTVAPNGGLNVQLVAPTALARAFSACPPASGGPEAEH